MDGTRDVGDIWGYTKIATRGPRKNFMEANFRKFRRRSHRLCSVNPTPTSLQQGPESDPEGPSDRGSYREIYKGYIAFILG